MKAWYDFTAEEWAALTAEEWSELLLVREEDALGALILARANDADSRAFAEYYCAARNISTTNILELDCSEEEILSSYSQFQAEIENDVFSYVESASTPVRFIIAGYRVPGGFIDGYNVISTQSRLSRLKHAYQNVPVENPLFARSYQPFDDTDADIALIVSRIDAPTLVEAKAMVDSMQLAARQVRINGQFIFDKIGLMERDEYGIPVESAEANYYNDLTDFETLLLPVLNMSTTSTVFWDEYTDVPVFRMEDESVAWTWMADRVGRTFFRENDRTRFFLYNADADGGYTMRDPESMRWPLLAMLAGYACTAGAMSDPGADGFLRPRPFFYALLNGATMGEAFTLACPYLDWTLGMFGDPLVTVRFPFGPNASSPVTADVAFSKMKDSLAEAVAFDRARQIALSTVRTTIREEDTQTVAELVLSAFNLESRGNMVESHFGRSCQSLFRFASQSVPIETYLTDNDFVVAEPMANIGGVYPNSALLYEQGSWFIEYTITHEASTYLIYHFELEAATDIDFQDVFLIADSDDSVTNWEYEKEQNGFEAFPTVGVTSSYAGRRVRFSATETRDRGNVFYVRIRQVDNFSTTTAWVVFTKVISS